tara:strand:+ start:1379 stop:1534 length:156 start_codon:yes stop_codon:yes gene_type:complete
MSTTSTITATATDAHGIISEKVITTKQAESPSAQNVVAPNGSSFFEEGSFA